MNKLGFYIENTTVEFLRDALTKVKPPTILVHAGDRGLMREIRAGLSPDAFVIGRIFVELDEQQAWLDGGDPEGRAKAFADRIINFDFGYALEKGTNGRPLIDAWMSLNESVPGPASFAGGSNAEERRQLFERRAPAYDRFQVAFRERLRSAGLEAVAFNFAAGNYTDPDHYLKWFPRTLESYNYLGFHEYGWPALKPGDGVSTGALYYRTCMQGIIAKYGDRYKAIITEAGLARGYRHPEGGDVGWLYPPDTRTEAEYWESLKWYNNELCQDKYMLGACLYEVGHAGGRWETFRHLGRDNQGQAILLMDKIAKLREDQPPAGDLTALRKRVAAAKTTLTPATQAPADLPSQVTAQGRALDALAEKAAAAAQLAGRVDALSARLDALQAGIEREQAAAQLSAEEAAGLKQQVAGLRTRLAAVRPGAADASAVATRLSQARGKMPAFTSQAQEANATIAQAKVLLEEANGLAAKLGS